MSDVYSGACVSPDMSGFALSSVRDVHGMLSVLSGESWSGHCGEC